MINSFPYDSWLDANGNLNQDITTFWTFGPAYGAEGGLTGTFVMTGLGMLLMVVSLVAWVWFENRRLNEQAERLRAGGLG